MLSSLGPEKKLFESTLQCSHFLNFFSFFFFFVGVCKKNVHAYAYGHPDHSKEDILVIGELPTDGLGDTTITTEAKYFFIITIVFVCVWCKDPLIQTRGLWNISYPLCLGKILKEFTADDMKKLDLI